MSQIMGGVASPRRALNSVSIQSIGPYYWLRGDIAASLRKADTSQAGTGDAVATWQSQDASARHFTLNAGSSGGGMIKNSGGGLTAQSGNQGSYSPSADLPSTEGYMEIFLVYSVTLYNKVLRAGFANDELPYALDGKTYSSWGLSIRPDLGVITGLAAGSYGLTCTSSKVNKDGAGGSLASARYSMRVERGGVVGTAYTDPTVGNCQPGAGRKICFGDSSLSATVGAWWGNCRELVMFAGKGRNLTDADRTAVLDELRTRWSF